MDHSETRTSKQKNLLRLPNLSLFKRSLLFESLRWQNYALLLIVCVAVALCLWDAQEAGTVQAARGAGSAFGLKFFIAVSLINALCLLLASTTAFASSITEEKEVNMLGLLLMTGITNFSLLFSKAASKLTLALVLLAVQIPFAVLAVTLGGISLEQIFAVNIALAAWAFFSCNVALFASVLMPGTVGAALLTLGMITGSLLLYRFHLNPFVTMSNILETGYSDGLWGWHVPINLAAGVGFFGLSLLLFRSDSNNRVAAVVEAPAAGVARATHSKYAPFIRVGRVWPRAALAWKEFYFSAGGKLALLVAGTLLSGAVAVAFWLAAVVGVFKGWAFAGAFMIFTGTVALLLQGAFLLPSVFGREVKQQTLPALVMLPGSLRKHCYMKILGMMPLFTLTLVYILSGRAIIWVVPEFIEVAVWVLVLLNVLFYFHLVVLLSLYMRFGAFALAAVIYIGCMFLLSLLMSAVALAFPISGGSVSATVHMSVMGGVLAISICILHRWIGRALLKLACQ